MTIQYPYNREKHFKLVKQSLNFKKDGKELFLENSKASKELISYEMKLFDHLFWTKKSDFVLLMQNYIGNSITPENFEIAFLSLWRSTINEFDEMRLDLERLKNFQPNPDSASCGTSISCVYRQFEELEDEVCTEQEARDYIMRILNQLNKVDETLLIEQILPNLSNSGSLTSTTYNDLNYEKLIRKSYTLFFSVSILLLLTLK